MTRWLTAARQARAAATEAPAPVPPEVSSVLSGAGNAIGRRAAEAPRVGPELSDAGVYFDFLTRHGPCTYGAAATALGWGATRAWRAEAELSTAGLVKLGAFGAAMPVNGAGRDAESNEAE